jgi:hypothetical protein
MSRIFGQIRSAGQGVPGLRVLAYEEVQYGFEEPDTPCRLGTPWPRLAGEGATDAQGNYSVTYDARQPLEDSCAFIARGYIRVFDGQALLLNSAKRSRIESLRIDADLGPVPPPDPPATGATIMGRLTFCGRPAADFRVVAFEARRVGIEDPEFHPPCRIGSEIHRNLGTAIVAADGTFSLAFAPFDPPEDACFFEAHIRLTVVDNTGRVWAAATRPAGDVIRYDAELVAGCTAGSGLIRVLDPIGLPVRDAQVFVNGVNRGLTNPLGLVVVDGLAAGDRVAARLRVHENETDRDAHDVDSDRDWNYRVYITSVPVTHDANGDHVRLPLLVVADPTAIQEVRLSRSNTLIALNLRVSVEWNAQVGQLASFRDRLLEVSQLMFNATDGQFCIERLAILDNGRLWDEADIQVYASINQHSNATVDGFFDDDGHIRMNPYDCLYPGTWLHELGHYAFGARDEYKRDDDWDNANGPPRCTLASTSGSPPFTDGAEKDSCLMRGAQVTSRKKFCSAHSANPHIGGTLQGDQDCWNTILERYGGPNWRLLTPVIRGAIPGRLPDSGEPRDERAPHQVRTLTRLATTFPWPAGSPVGTSAASNVPARARISLSASFWKPRRWPRSGSRSGRRTAVASTRGRPLMSPSTSRTA